MRTIGEPGRIQREAPVLKTGCRGSGAAVDRDLPTSRPARIRSCTQNRHRSQDCCAAGRLRDGDSRGLARGTIHSQYGRIAVDRAGGVGDYAAELLPIVRIRRRWGGISGAAASGYVAEAGTSGGLRLPLISGSASSGNRKDRRLAGRNCHALGLLDDYRGGRPIARRVYRREDRDHVDRNVDRGAKSAKLLGRHAVRWNACRRDVADGVPTLGAGGLPIELPIEHVRDLAVRQRRRIGGAGHGGGPGGRRLVALSIGSAVGDSPYEIFVNGSM